jgi:hypothetical protein
MMRFRRADANITIIEIMWHRWKIRRQTEKTNINVHIGRNRSLRLNYNML